MILPRFGVFCFFDHLTAAESAAFAARVERLGYGVAWVVESLGRDSIAHSIHLLARTERLVVGTGVASVWGREPIAMAAGARTAAEMSDGRFVLGLGINNPTTVALRGRTYERPVETMRSYLARMKEAPFAAPRAAGEPPVVLAALNPRMLALAAAEADGAITYFMPPEHTGRARAALGPERWLCAEQAVLLERNPAKARALARQYMSFYVPHIAVYRRALGALGFGADDFGGELSDRLVDAVVAWGDETRLRERIGDHFRAGASHVCVLALDPGGSPRPDAHVLEALAPGA